MPTSFSFIVDQYSKIPDGVEVVEVIDGYKLKVGVKNPKAQGAYLKKVRIECEEVGVYSGNDTINDLPKYQSNGITFGMIFLEDGGWNVCIKFINENGEIIR